MNITIAGGGAFGTSLANALKKDNQITIHTRNKQVISDINTFRKNTSYFPNKVLSKKIKAATVTVMPTCIQLAPVNVPRFQKVMLLACGSLAI